MNKQLDQDYPHFDSYPEKLKQVEGTAPESAKPGCITARVRYTGVVPAGVFFPPVFRKVSRATSTQDAAWLAKKSAVARAYRYMSSDLYLFILMTLPKAQVPRQQTARLLTEEDWRTHASHGASSSEVSRRSLNSLLTSDGVTF